MAVVGSVYGDDNFGADGLGKGFTVVCNDCGIFLTNDCMDGDFCIFCDQVACFTCPACKQESHIHNSIHCTREGNYVRKTEEPLEQVRVKG